MFISICTALYDYVPQGDNELELKEGDLVYILEKAEDAWWTAKKKNGEEPTGLIPNNYIEEVRSMIVFTIRYNFYLLPQRALYT